MNPHKPKWAKLTKEQLEMLAFSTYEGEIVLIDTALEVVDPVESFYFNAQEFFTKQELEEMPVFSTDLFPLNPQKH